MSGLQYPYQMLLILRRKDSKFLRIIACFLIFFIKEAELRLQ